MEHMYPFSKARGLVVNSPALKADMRSRRPISAASSHSTRQVSQALYIKLGSSGWTNGSCRNVMCSQKIFIAGKRAARNRNHGRQLVLLEITHDSPSTET